MKIISPQNSFSNILEDAKRRVDAMPKAKTKKLKESLEHGLAELKTEDEMDMYLSSYGTMHQEKLLVALTSFQERYCAKIKSQ